MATPVLIAGAGIGGLSAALALARLGVRSQLIERAPEIREVGAGLQLGPNGFRAFERLGVAKAMDAISFQPKAIRLMDSVKAIELSRQTLGAPFEARFGHPYRVAYRADVQRVLLDAVRAHPDLVSISLGDGVRSIAQTEDQVIVTLDSGRAVSGDAVIGADGLWSAVRDHVCGAQPPRSSGHVAYRHVSPVSRTPAKLLSGDVQVWIGPGHHLVCYKLRGGELFNIVAIFHGERAVQGWDTLGDKAELRRAFAQACEPVRLLVEEIDQGRVWVLCDRDPSPGWSRGRVTLLGDAAHPMLPYLAQGACMAIEDAVSLADGLAAAPDDPSGAFQAYEQARLARTASVQMAARETGAVNHAAGAERERRNAFLATRRADDYEAIAWLFGGDGPRPQDAAGADIGIFGRHAPASGAGASRGGPALRRPALSSSTMRRA